MCFDFDEGTRVLNLKKLERTIGGLKFAVILILIFSALMVIGTVFESTYGTEFANRMIYKRWPFMLVQFGMFTSILFATFLRLPPKKRLYGFYAIHSGLILLGCGSFITYYSGVDGSLSLAPQTPNRHIVLPEDQILIEYPDEGKRVTKTLPEFALPGELDWEYKDFKFKRFIPYADKKLVWKKDEKALEGQHSGQYMISNDSVAQEFTVSLHPKTQDFEANLRMGPLTINYLPQNLGKCFGQTNPSGLILWNQNKQLCFTPEERKISIQTTNTGKRFFAFHEDDMVLSFFPDHSPWPLDKDLKPIPDTSYRVFSKAIFEKNPQLFLFGKSAGYYLKDDKKWETKLIPEKGLELPWMGFQLSLIAHQEQTFPTYEPQAVWPVQSNNELIKGKWRALEVEVKGKTYFLTNEKPLQLLIDGKRNILYLTKKTLTLPFEFSLTRFKMDKDPGTNRPASYESFVRVFSAQGPKEHHVYMNNPLKIQGFTFYQASYFKDDRGAYHSTLSANVDPGRAIKYLGSLLLVLGGIWHYNLNYSKKKMNAKKELKGQA